MRNFRVWIALTMLGIVVGAPSPAAAQAQRTGPTFNIGGTTSPVILPDVAYDSLHDRYLEVAGNTFIQGHLLDGAGNRLLEFPVQAGGYSQTPRVAFSPHINNNAGGYLVTWHESIGNLAYVYGRVVSADGALLTAPFPISLEVGAPGTSTNWTMGAAVAYSTGSREFLVSWMGAYGSAQNIHFTRVNIAGQVLQPPVAITSGVDWERDPAVAYSFHDDEFYIVYAGYREAFGYGYVAGQRVKAGTGALLPSASGELIQAVATLVPAVAYNPNSRQYVISWYHRSSGGAAMYGINVQASTGGAASAVRVMSGYYFAYDANDLDYSSATGDFLLVTHGQNWEDAAVSIKSDGAPLDNGFVLTNTPDYRPVTAGDGNFNPRVASGNNGRYLAVTAAKFAMIAGQFVTSTAGGPVLPPPPPPPTPQPMMFIDYPATNSMVQTQFSIAGWALDRGSSTGTGVAAVHVWAFPTNGASPIFVGAASLGVSRPDVAGYLGDQRFMPSGFALSGNLPQGTYDLRVSMLSTVAGTFNMNAVTRITIAAPASIPRMSVDLPIQNQFVTTSFSISGWAVDQGSTADTGVDGIHVWAYPVAGGDPIFVGAASLGVSRPDVAAYLGSGRFGPSGYFLQGTLPRGQYYLVVFAHSNLALSFNQAAVVIITVV